MPAHALDTQPTPGDVAVPASEYPEEARVASFEGSVLLKILIDETGRVREAKVLRDPGRGVAALGGYQGSVIVGGLSQAPSEVDGS